MIDRAANEFRRAGETPPAVRAQWVDRWFGRVVMLLCTILLLTFSYAPYGQFYLAWIGLVPFLLMVRRTRSAWTAFGWGWGGGTAYFIANMWWLAYVTVPGMFALLGYLGLSWGVAAAIIRGGGLMGHGKWKMENGKGENNRQWAMGNGKSPPFSIFAIATVWSGCEWFRGNYPFDGLPWLYIGHSQTPFLVMCQIADVFGATGVTFWVVLVNALLAMLWVSRLSPSPGTPGEGRGEGSSAIAQTGQSDRTLTLTLSRRTGRGDKIALAGVAVILIAIGAYGAFRMNPKTLLPGPRVMVVQANFPQSNETGKKGASIEEIVRFHLETTDSSLIAHRSSLSSPVDLVVWSETMMPDLNPRARQLFQGHETDTQKDLGAFLDRTFDQIQSLAHRHKTAMIVGGSYFDARMDRQADQMIYDNRNSAYFFDRTGLPAGRYDKIHLVPWGEFIPFKHSIPWLYQIFLELSPYDYDYTLTPGKLDELKVFELSDPGSAGVWRFVVPICFEDIDAGLVAKMLRPLPDGNQNKRADFLVNITNDGWFKANQQPQHFQVAIFRSIENRVPTARSVNTGISGFIDPLGRVDRARLIAQSTHGWQVATLTLDSRTSLFTLYGEWFAKLCAVVTGVVAMASMVRWIGSRGRVKKT